MPLVALDRPDGARNKAGLGRDVIQPHHSFEGFNCLGPGLFVAGGREFEGHGGQVLGGVSAVVVADLAEPAVFVSRPVKLVDEAQPLEPPFLQLALEVSRLLQQRVGFVANDAQPAVGRDIDHVISNRNVAHVIARQPVLRAEVVVLALGLANGAPGRADPHVAVEPRGQVGRVFVGEAIRATQAGQRHAAQHGHTAVSCHIEPAAEREQVAGDR